MHLQKFFRVLSWIPWPLNKNLEACSSNGYPGKAALADLKDMGIAGRN